VLPDKHDGFPGFFRQLDAFFIGNDLRDVFIPVRRFKQVTFLVYLYALIVYFKTFV
jgi:hypothetical protein